MHRSIIIYLTRNQWHVVIGTCLFIVTAGLVYSTWLGDIIRFSDERAYLALSHNLLHSGIYSLDGVQATAYRPPGYAFILCGLAWLIDDLLAFRMLNYVALAMSLVLLFKLVLPEGKNIGALAAVLLAAVNPVNFYTAGAIYPQTIASTMFLGVLLMFAANIQFLDARRSILGGALMGALVLTVPTFLLACFLITLWLIAVQRMRGLILAILIAVGSALVLLPWTARNYDALGAFVPFATISGTSLLLANNEHANWNSNVAEIDISSHKSRVKSLGLNEVETDRYMREAALEWIGDNKIQAIEQYIGRTVHYFSPYNSMATDVDDMNKAQVISAIYYSLLLFIFFVRIILWRSFPPSRLERLLLFLYILNALFAALFLTRIRYRIPFDFALIAAIGIFTERLFLSADRNSERKHGVV